MAFYDKFLKLKEELEALGHEVFIPSLKFESKKDDTSVGGFIERSGGMEAFPPEHEFWVNKGKAIQAHFEKIDEHDCILVTNYEKKGIPNYIGGNTFLEIGHAFGSGKKIFILNKLPKESPYLEEIMGMQPIILDGGINKIG